LNVFKIFGTVGFMNEVPPVSTSYWIAMPDSQPSQVDPEPRVKRFFAAFAAYWAVGTGGGLVSGAIFGTCVFPVWGTMFGGAIGTVFGFLAGFVGGLAVAYIAADDLPAAVLLRRAKVVSLLVNLVLGAGLAIWTVTWLGRFAVVPFAALVPVSFAALWAGAVAAQAAASDSARREIKNGDHGWSPDWWLVFGVSALVPLQTWMLIVPVMRWVVSP
jgi:hypothetical protein